MPHVFYFLQKGNYEILKFMGVKEETGSVLVSGNPV